MVNKQVYNLITSFDIIIRMTVKALHKLTDEYIDYERNELMNLRINEINNELNR
jgi:hypothetical protein